MLPLITFTSPIAQALVSSAVIVSKSMATKFKFLIKTKTVHTSGGHSLGANLKNSCYALLLRSSNALNGRYQSFHAAKVQKCSNNALPFFIFIRTNGPRALSVARSYSEQGGLNVSHPPCSTYCYSSLGDVIANGYSLTCSHQFGQICVKCVMRETCHLCGDVLTACACEGDA